MTAAIGVLKVAAIVPDALQSMRVLIICGGSLKYFPTTDPNVEPICTIGPSRPTETPALAVRSRSTEYRSESTHHRKTQWNCHFPGYHY